VENLIKERGELLLVEGRESAEEDVEDDTD
jgi:hypothetical protein